MIHHYSPMRINTIICVIGISNRELLRHEPTRNVAISFFQPVLIREKVQTAHTVCYCSESPCFTFT